ncbi:ABC-type uncharacterized transport system substrate-binding protein [Ochrobactrum daejeonense]|uniref:ABC-type uncharacterized transport system substrate-binding protein n=1 Tax=Brucella daejeonensis TaxID=659015 RepID=A0A7W9B1I6_9HYPH|nr:DUF1007 family protein [Brucella daejeonensis]MBB5704501.1 ABC-type uncharacterized transport system substrate-binding protein [Brucella daejeonensis]
MPHSTSWLKSRFVRFATVGIAAASALPSPALAHPHVFAEARLELTVAPDGAVEKLAHVWRFDDVFSSTVLMEFDKNGDLQLDKNELLDLGRVINESIAEFKYFQSVLDNGKDVKMAKPTDLAATFTDNRLLIVFTSKPEQPLKLAAGHKVSFGVYDPTFYTAIDYVNDNDLVVNGLPAGCAPKVVRPDPDEALAQNQASLTEAFFNDPAGTDMSKIFATRLEIDCATSGKTG